MKLRRSSLTGEEGCQLLRIACLHEHCAWAGELADKSFASSKAAHDASRCHALNDILTVPRNQVTVVDHVLLVRLELSGLLAQSLDKGVAPHSRPFE